MKRFSSPKIWISAVALTGAAFHATSVSAGTPSALNFSMHANGTCTTTQTPCVPTGFSAATATNTLGSMNTQTVATLMTWSQMAPSAQANAYSFQAQAHRSGSNSILNFSNQQPEAIRNQKNVFNLEDSAKKTGIVGFTSASLFGGPQDNSIDPDLQMISNMKQGKIDMKSVPAPILLSPMEAGFVASVTTNAANWAQTDDGKAAMAASTNSAAPDSATLIQNILQSP